MSLYDELIEHSQKIAVVGLGYVGLPIAVAFSKRVSVIGFDLNEQKIESYRLGMDPTNEIGEDALRKCSVVFTSDEHMLKEAKFFIVAVPTPITLDKTPDLTPVESASTIIGRNLKPGSIVVYESTVYPGVTEDICIPILEKISGLKCGIDFKVGYSPERINPGDKVHTLENIVKIVSGTDSQCLEEISKVYGLVIKGIYRAGSIKVAEAAKVAENSQRDINIAFMNELAMVFDRMGIDTKDVIRAMKTKWNALGFYPGLVGGHCIGVDPYYFIYQAERLGYHSQIILSGRKINDSMPKMVCEAIIKRLVLANKVVTKSRVAILGITFKENVPDIRNSKVSDIIHCLNEYGIEPMVVDPVANKQEVTSECGFDLVSLGDLRNLDCLVIAVPHYEFKDIEWESIDCMFDKSNMKEKVIIDVKGILNRDEAEERGYCYWSL